MSTSTPDTLRHYGWTCSPYSGKTRTYLRHKGVAFEDIHPNAIQLMRVLNRRAGRVVMPIVVMPDDTTVQDSTEIIDAVERLHPRGSV